jgi:hypothetical protein
MFSSLVFFTMIQRTTYYGRGQKLDSAAVNNWDENEE